MTGSSQVEAVIEGRLNYHLQSQLRERLVAEIEGAKGVAFHPNRLVVILHPGTDKARAQQKLNQILREHFAIVLPSPPPSDDLW